MIPSDLNKSINDILQITDQMHEAAEGLDWEKTIALQTLLDTKLHDFFSQDIAEQDAGIVREMIEKVLEFERQLKLSAQKEKNSIHSASKKLSNELSALAAYAHSIE